MGDGWTPHCKGRNETVEPYETEHCGDPDCEAKHVDPIEDLRNVYAVVVDGHCNICDWPIPKPYTTTCPHCYFPIGKARR